MKKILKSFKKYLKTMLMAAKLIGAGLATIALGGAGATSKACKCNVGKNPASVYNH